MKLSNNKLTVYSLKLIPPGEKVEIIYFTKETPFIKQLRNLGLKEGTIVEVFGKDFTGTKFLLKLNESLIALDIELINSILVKPLVNRYLALKEKYAYDLLTGCLRRDYAEEIIKKALVQPPVSIGLADIDNFKAINDSYGHLCGDLVLKEVSRILQNNLRKSDLVVRWGGEEFLLLFKRTTLDLAFRICDRIRRAISEKDIEYDGKLFKVTLSFGVCGVPPLRPMEVLLKEADDALYQAKKTGKNKVVCCY